MGFLFLFFFLVPLETLENKKTWQKHRSNISNVSDIFNPGKWFRPEPSTWMATATDMGGVVYDLSELTLWVKHGNCPVLVMKRRVGNFPPKSRMAANFPLPGPLNGLRL